VHSAVATNLENLQLLENLKYTDAKGVQRPLNMAAWNGRLLLIDDSVPYAGGKYTSYILGDGAFDYCDAGARVPFEMHRDPHANGGMDTLYTRQRKLFAPRGISFTATQLASASPTNAELEAGANWALVNDGATSPTAIDHRAIPIARIISVG
jgi:hypothetical protein